MNIELELKVDEVIKRLDRDPDYHKAYDEWYMKNAEWFSSRKSDEFAYLIFRYDTYRFEIIKEKDFKQDIPKQFIMLGGF